MFSRKDQLLRKTGPDGIGRFDYLRLLKKEFNETNSEEAKAQVLANLANFCYDPINYEYIRSLDLISLFLTELQSPDRDLCKFASAAICNLSADPRNCEIIIRKNGVQIMSTFLTNTDVDILLNIIASYYFIYKNISLEEIEKIFTKTIKQQIKELKETTRNIRVKKLLNVLPILQDDFDSTNVQQPH